MFFFCFFLFSKPILQRCLEHTAGFGERRTESLITWLSSRAIFCLFRRVKRACPAHKSASTSDNKMGRCEYTNMQEYVGRRERIFLARGIEKLSAPAQSLAGKVGPRSSFCSLSSPPLSLPDKDLGGSLYIFYIFLTVLPPVEKSRGKLLTARKYNLA